jgi:hypothetical protein
LSTASATHCISRTIVLQVVHNIELDVQLAIGTNGSNKTRIRNATGARASSIGRTVPNTERHNGLATEALSSRNAASGFVRKERSGDSVPWTRVRNDEINEAAHCWHNFARLHTTKHFPKALRYLKADSYPASLDHTGSRSFRILSDGNPGEAHCLVLCSE